MQRKDQTYVYEGMLIRPVQDHHSALLEDWIAFWLLPSELSKPLIMVVAL
jgi:hypothetical protein